MSMKNSMTTLDIEHATFQLAAQCPQTNQVIINKKSAMPITKDIVILTRSTDVINNICSS